MKATCAAALAAALFAFSTQSAWAQDWIDIKDSQSFRELFTNKTHRSRAYVAHYRTDGQGILQMTGSDIRHPRLWQVKGDQVCIGTKGDEPTCYRYQRSAKNPAEILGTSEQRGQRVTHWFNIEDGIPKF